MLTAPSQHPTPWPPPAPRETRATGMPDSVATLRTALDDMAVALWERDAMTNPVQLRARIASLLRVARAETAVISGAWQ